MLTNYSRANYFERVAPLPRSSLSIYISSSFTATFFPLPFPLPSLKISFTFLLHFSFHFEFLLSSFSHWWTYTPYEKYVTNIYRVPLVILFLNPNHFSFFFSVFQRTRKIIRCFLYPLIEQVRRIFQEIFRIFPFSSRLAVSRENFSGLANYERSVETSKRSNNLIFDFSIYTFSLTEMVRRFP